MSHETTPRRIRRLYETFRRGDSLTTQEMVELRDHLRRLMELASPLPAFGCITHGLGSDIASLNSYSIFREQGWP